MSALARTSLVIPVGRDDARLAALLDELGTLDLEGAEVIVVDNEARPDVAPPGAGFGRSAARHRVVRAATPGKGAAVRAGLLAAARPLRVFTDVDLPYGLEGVRSVAEALAEGSAPVVVGSRLVPGSTGGTGLLRSVMSRVFRAWTALCLGLGDLGDTQCGLKGFREDVTAPLFEPLATQGFAFDCEVLARARNLGLAVRPVAVALRPSPRGSSIEIVRDSYRMFRDVWRLRRVVRGLAARGPV